MNGKHFVDGFYGIVVTSRAVMEYQVGWEVLKTSIALLLGGGGIPSQYHPIT